MVLELVYIFLYIGPMKTTTLSNFRRTMATSIDKVTSDHEPLVITRGTGKSSAVLMSLEDFASYEETRYLLQNPDNAERLLKAVADLDAGISVEKQLIE